jgi:hypothetical protein
MLNQTIGSTNPAAPMKSLLLLLNSFAHFRAFHHRATPAAISTKKNNSGSTNHHIIGDPWYTLAAKKSPTWSTQTPSDAISPNKNKCHEVHRNGFFSVTVRIKPHSGQLLDVERCNVNPQRGQGPSN